MDSQLEKISSVECRVKVEIPWSDVGPRLDGKMRELRHQVNIPGFRRGKVPPHVLDRLYGKGVREELAQEMVQETFQTAVVTHETTPLTQPVLESHNLEKGKPFLYTARFEVAPVIEPKDYEGVEVRRRPAIVNDEQVEAVIEQKRKELTEIRPLPEDSDRTKTREGDIWTVDVEGTFGEQQITRKDLRLEVGAEQEFIPGINGVMAALEMSEVGSSKEVSWTPPQENLKDEFKGEMVKLTMGLREVREKVVPEVDDEFARDTGMGESVEELKAAIRKDIEEQDKVDAEREARRRLVVSLLEANDFEPAPSMVQREVAAQVDMFRQQMAQQGVSIQQLGMSESDLGGRMRPQALFNVKAFLLLDAIGKKHEIDTSDEEVDKEVEEMAAEQGQNAARLRATMERNNQLLLLRAQLREEKILDFLMSKAKVTEAPDPDTEAETGGDAIG